MTTPPRCQIEGCDRLADAMLPTELDIRVCLYHYVYLLGFMLREARKATS